MTPAAEEWYAVAVHGKHVTPEGALDTAIAAVDGRRDLMRPLVVMVNAAVDPGLFARMEVAEVRQAAFVPHGEFRFLKGAAS